MNCNEFNKNLIDLFDSNPDRILIGRMEDHMANCSSCKAEYITANETFARLKPSNSFNLPDSGLKQQILNQLKAEEFDMEENKSFRLKKWHKRVLAVAASIAFVIAVFTLANRSPFINTAQAAEKIMVKSITAMESLRSMFISMQVRSLENGPFDMTGTEYEFIEYKYWKQFTGVEPWRIEKPGRIAAYDGEKQYLYLPELSYAIYSSKNIQLLDFLQLFLEPKSIMESELEFSQKNDAKYNIEKTVDEIILTVSADALGDFHNNYRKNTSVFESDNTRIYFFDKKTSLLKSFELYINSNGHSTKVIEIQNIAYNIPISVSTFSIELPNAVKWQELTDPGHIKAFTKISSKQAAEKFFTALSSEDYEVINPVWDALQISDQEKLAELKSTFGGLELIELGEPFKSGLYPGEFVPYKIKFRSGEVKEFNLALRNDNPTKTWIVDGGI